MVATFRVSGIDTMDQDLILSRLLPWGSGGEITLMSVASTVPPVFGAVDSLLLDDASTVTFAAADVRQPGFALTVTVAAASDLWGVRFAGPDRAAWVLGYSLSGPAGTCTFPAVQWLGADVLSPAPSMAAHWGLASSWEAQPSAASGYWTCCALSADGRVQLAVRGDSVRLSKDGGLTWADTGLGNRSWTCCAVAADGQTLLVGCANTSGNSYLWLSKDGGGTWIVQTSAGNRYWRSCAVSEDGRVLIAAGDSGGSGYMYLSKDSGDTWAQASAGYRKWHQCAVSADGQVLLATDKTDSSSYLTLSKDGGVTWANITSAGASYWYGCAMSPNGQILLAASYSSSTGNGYMQLSKDGGATWTTLTHAGLDVWWRCAMSADGRVLLGGGGSSSFAALGLLSLSVDGGATWVPQVNLGVGSWEGCAVSADGRLLLAGVNAGSGKNLLLRAMGDPIYINQPLRTLVMPALRVQSDVLPVTQGLITTALIQSPERLMDAEMGGCYRIHGTVARNETPANVPLIRRVRLHRSRDGMLVRETWSKADGSYEFTGISGRYEYDVIAWDHELQFRSVVANNLVPEVMP